MSFREEKKRNTHAEISKWEKSSFEFGCIAIPVCERQIILHSFDRSVYAREVTAVVEDRQDRERPRWKKQRERVDLPIPPIATTELAVAPNILRVHLSML